MENNARNTVNQTKKKVLFLITKSNWGEKWDGPHFARPCQISLERSGKVSTRCTAAVSGS